MVAQFVADRELPLSRVRLESDRPPNGLERLVVFLWPFLGNRARADTDSFDSLRAGSSTTNIKNVSPSILVRPYDGSASMISNS